MNLKTENKKFQKGRRGNLTADFHQKKSQQTTTTTTIEKKKKNQIIKLNREKEREK